jgi:HAD superfamily hydrolase (TIGR01490 family)
MKKIGVFDLDGTVYRDTLTFSVAEELLKRPAFASELAQVETARATWKAHESNESYWIYNKAMLTAFETILPQVSPSELHAAATRVLAAKQTHTYAYPITLIKKLQKEGRLLIAISGSITDIVTPFAQAFGFEVIVASELEIVDGAYTGKRISQTNTNKDQLLRSIIEQHDATLTDSIGIGDTHRDISFLSIVEHPIAFNPNAALYEEAATRGWGIVIERKNMVYELTHKKDGYKVHTAHPLYEGGHQERLR